VYREWRLKRSSSFWGKKECTPRENPGYACGKESDWPMANMNEFMRWNVVMMTAPISRVDWQDSAKPASRSMMKPPRWTTHRSTWSPLRTSLRHISVQCSRHTRQLAEIWRALGRGVGMGVQGVFTFIPKKQEAPKSME